MARSRSTRQGRTVSRRRTGWFAGVGGNASATFAASASSFQGSALGPFSDGTTIARIRGFLELILTSASALGDGFHGAVGIGIVEDSAFAIGITAMPIPVTDSTWEGWMWHQYFSLTAPTAAQVSENRQTFVVDSKAMRKIGSNETLVAITEATEVGASGLILRLNTRTLVFQP